MSKLLVGLLATLCALPMAAQKESLLIGPGDLLHVQFYDTPELEQTPHVDDAGAVSLLFLGTVSVAGKTPVEAANAVASLMVARHVMTHPQVTVTIDQYATQDVSVTGELVHPGTYHLATPRPVLDVLTLAGGLNSLADRTILIQHRGAGAGRETYFVANDPLQSSGEDVLVRPGDMIVVPRAGFVYLLGDVGRPGGYPLYSNNGHVTLLQALSTAGSTNKTAVISAVRVMRKQGDQYVQLPVHLGRIEAGKEPDPELRADDVVIVPFSYIKNFILNGTAIAASVASAALYR